MGSSGVSQLRIVLTASDLDDTLRIYRDGLGLRVLEEWRSAGARGVLLEVGNATLELIDRGQAELIDGIEVGERVAGPVRLAFAVPDVRAATDDARRAGARVLSGPVRTPWGDLNVRLEATDGLQVTLFQPPVAGETGKASQEAHHDDR